MKQVFQSYRDGEVRVEDVPSPSAEPGRVLVRNRVSLISAGTERSMIEMGQKSLAGKAVERPDLARKVLKKVRRDGVLPATRAVLERLEEPVPLGYSSAGQVVKAGDEVEDLPPGTAVACAGAGHAVHASYVSVPRNLVVPFPEWHSNEAPYEAAAFTTVGAIALQGVRVADVRIGERVAVLGLGLVGLLTVQVLRSAGCQVVGMDPDTSRARLARKLGCEEAVTDSGAAAEAVRDLTAGHGADAVLLTASTSTNEPVRVGAQLSREKGRVVVVGAVGLNVPRAPYYDRELELRFSRSYGPGRHDREYEEKGYDYPYGFVRWTEGRNLAAFLELVARGDVRTAPLVTHRFPIGEADTAYRLILDDEAAGLGVLLTYPGNGAITSQSLAFAGDEVSEPKSALAPKTETVPSASGGATMGVPGDDVRIAFLGAGQFAGSVLLPALSEVDGVELVSVCTRTGLSARRTAERFGFGATYTDPEEIFGDPGVDAVFVATRHNHHARFVIAALEAGKHVFCEKPLCLDLHELERIESAWEEALKWGGESGPPVIMLGFNRRFAPMTTRVRQLLCDCRAPATVVYRVAAGRLPDDHWLHDREVGGGRIVGEVCHFVDWIEYVVGSSTCEVRATGLKGARSAPDEDVSITLKLRDGSIGTIHYLACGGQGLTKERIEMFAGKISVQIEDFRTGSAWMNGERERLSRRFFPSQQKGHREELEAFLRAVRNRECSPVTLEDAVRVTRVTLAAVRSLREGVTVKIGEGCV